MEWSGFLLLLGGLSIYCSTDTSLVACSTGQSLRRMGTAAQYTSRPRSWPTVGSFRGTVHGLLSGEEGGAKTDTEVRRRERRRSREGVYLGQEKETPVEVQSFLLLEDAVGSSRVGVVGVWVTALCPPAAH